MRVLITEDYPGVAEATLREAAYEVTAIPAADRHDPNMLRAMASGCDAVLAGSADRLDSAFFAECDGALKIVATSAVGFNNIDLAAAAAHRVIVTNAPDVLTDATAELTIGLILALTRRIAEGDRLLRHKIPWQFAPRFMLGTGLSGRTLGVIGFGRIGRAVAARAASFGMSIVYSSPRQVNDAAGATRLSQSDLLRSADIVTLHCRLSNDTIHLIDAAALKAMKPAAYLVNAARGSIVDEQALVDALRAGEIAGAALDVFEHEPDVHPGLLELENVVLTPHIGSAVDEVRAAMASLAAANIIAVLSGKAPLTPVGAD